MTGKSIQLLLYSLLGVLLFMSDSMLLGDETDKVPLVGGVGVGLGVL